MLLRAQHLRAGPALPSYLALLHAGFSEPRMSPSERWALTPPFHPCQMPLTETGQPRLFPGACRRGVSGTWRYIFCGTFRSHVPKVCFRPPLSATPWRYQARCPFVVGPFEWTTNGVRTFLPSACRAKGSGPAITQLTRHVRLYAPARGATIEPGLTIGHKGLSSCRPKKVRSKARAHTARKHFVRGAHRRPESPMLAETLGTRRMDRAAGSSVPKSIQ